MSATWVGIPPAVVRRWRAVSSRASAARQRLMRKVVPPARSVPGSLVMNPTWAKDVPASVRPPPPHPSPTSTRVIASSWRLANTAPFGGPVVPEVNTMATGRSGSAGRGGGASPKRRAAMRAVSSSMSEEASWCRSAERRRGGSLAVPTLLRPWRRRTLLGWGTLGRLRWRASLDRRHGNGGREAPCRLLGDQRLGHEVGRAGRRVGGLVGGRRYGDERASARVQVDGDEVEQAPALVALGGAQDAGDADLAVAHGVGSDGHGGEGGRLTGGVGSGAA